MTGKAEMTPGQDVIAESNVSEMIRELIIKLVHRLADVQGRTERLGNAVNDVAIGAGKGDNDMIKTMMGTYANGGAVEVGASAVVWARAGNDADREVHQEVT